ncbi:MAG: competence protein ComK [Candidatus Izemoplasmatales bacterium]|uniref:Uncharacterized protein n=1 Tax=Hujiaoplasma nucleasis TaxID=2725268 RepID=A0A7L6N1D3_9MOLU|nr:competence protein ComK [Hujiaoplasma nucleasis]QLY40066.1 hypothetical protein HF295_04000 [Hujiaoplasma nucleasis]
MDYIKLINYKIYVCQNQNIRIYDEPIVRFFNRILKDGLVDLKTREYLTKRKFGFKNKIPLVVNQEMAFLCIQSYRLEQAFYINYHQILYWEKSHKSVIIYFKDGHCLKVYSYDIFIKQIDKVKTILNL